jgi:hypothetical protein
MKRWPRVVMKHTRCGKGGRVGDEEGLIYIARRGRTPSVLPLPSAPSSTQLSSRFPVLMQISLLPRRSYRPGSPSLCRYRSFPSYPNQTELLHADLSSPRFISQGFGSKYTRYSLYCLPTLTDPQQGLTSAQLVVHIPMRTLGASYHLRGGSDRKFWI